MPQDSVGTGNRSSAARRWRGRAVRPARGRRGARPENTAPASLRSTPVRRALALAALLFLSTGGGRMPFLARPLQAGEWPQILGPERRGRAADDERLADAWPAGGPAVVWERDVGRGYAGVVVAEGRAFLFHRRGGEEVLEALDAATGRTLWTDAHPTTFRPQVGGGDGPLATPTVAGGTIVSFGAQGVLTANDAATGKRLWQHATHAEHGAQEGYFGAGSSPIVAAGRVIVNVGGTRGVGGQGAGIVAYDLATGRADWSATKEPASYASPVAVPRDGSERILFVTRYQCLLLDPADGTVRWQFPFGMRGPTVNAAAPAIVGADRLLVTASYGIGSVLARFDDAGAEPVWKGDESLASQYCTPVVVGDHAYALDGREDGPPGDLVCVDLATGRAAWREESFGYGSLLVADGKLVILRNDGTVVLARASPDGYRELGRHRALGVGCRAQPALAGGRLYIRDDSRLVSLDLGPR